MSTTNRRRPDRRENETVRVPVLSMADLASEYAQQWSAGGSAAAAERDEDDEEARSAG